MQAESPQVLFPHPTWLGSISLLARPYLVLKNDHVLPISWAALSVSLGSKVSQFFAFCLFLFFVSTFNQNTNKLVFFFFFF